MGLSREISFVSGTTPTRKGSISASFNVSTSDCSVTIPCEVVARIGLPKVGKTIHSLYIDGVLVWSGLFHNNWLGSEDSDFIYISSMQPGTYAIKVSYIGNRSAAAIHTRDPEATFQTMYADIIVSGANEFIMALYFVDWDSYARRLAVQLMDAATLKQIAPVKVVNDYHLGKYLVYMTDRSVRVRIDTIRKPNSTLSGIFFSDGFSQ